MQDRHVLGIHRGLHAERAADVADQHVHLVGGDPENIDKLALHAEGALAADVHRVAPARFVERSNRGAGSIALTTTRLLTSFNFVTCAALEKASATFAG